MEINNILYIYYEEDGKKIKLKDYKILLSDSSKNKEKIIEIFKMKFEKDFLLSSAELLKTNNLYPAAMILASSLDVLAKHYFGEEISKGIGDKYKEFIRKYFEEFQNTNLVNKVYHNFRCSLVHSNSAKIDFTLNKEIPDIYNKSGKIVFNLNWLLLKINTILNEYLKTLEQEYYFENFKSVQEEIYYIKPN